LLAQKGTRVYERNILAASNWRQIAKDQGVTERQALDHIKMTAELEEFMARTEEVKWRFLNDPNGLISPEKAVDVKGLYNVRRGAYVREHEVKRGWTPLFNRKFKSGGILRRGIPLGQAFAILGVAGAAYTLTEGELAAEEAETEVRKWRELAAKGGGDDQLKFLILSQKIAGELGGGFADNLILRNLLQAAKLHSGNISEDVKASIDIMGEAP